MKIVKLVIIILQLLQLWIILLLREKIINIHAVYSEITTSDENYSLYDLLLKPDDILKVVSGKSDNNNQSYYVLKKNGNVYNYTITKADRNTPPVITNTTIFYSQGDFGGQIIDFNYAGDSTSTYVKTNNKIYRMYVK